MAVTWEWKHKRGEILLKTEETKKSFKLGIYGGNCLGAIIYRYKNEQGEKYYNFISFINDVEHARRMLKKDKDIFNKLTMPQAKVKCFKLCVSSSNKWENKEALKLGELLAKNGYKVILY